MTASAGAQDVVQGLLRRLQAYARTKDVPATLTLFEPDPVLIGTAAESIGPEQTEHYIRSAYAAQGYIRWSFDSVAVLDETTDRITFTALGTVGLDDAPGQGQGHGQRQPFRLTGLLLRNHDQWRLRLFHGSLREPDPQED